MKQKKSIQLNQAFGAVLTLILVALLVVIAIYMISSLETTFRVTGTAGSVVNETVTSLSNSTGDYLANYNLRDVACSVSIVTNATSGATVPSTNYTMTNCLIKGTSDTPYLGNNVNVSYAYTYTADTSASNASTSIITQFAAYPALIGLVGTIIFLALVIGVLVASFAFGGRKGV